MAQSLEKFGTGCLTKSMGRSDHIPRSSKRKLDSDKFNHVFKAIQIKW